MDQRRRQGGWGHTAICYPGALASKGGWGNEALDKLLATILRRRKHLALKQVPSIVRAVSCLREKARYA